MKFVILVLLGISALATAIPHSPQQATKDPLGAAKDFPKEFGKEFKHEEKHAHKLKPSHIVMRAEAAAQHNPEQAAKDPLGAAKDLPKDIKKGERKEEKKERKEKHGKKRPHVLVAGEEGEE